MYYPLPVIYTECGQWLETMQGDVGEIVKIHRKLKLLRITSPKSPGNAQQDQPCVRYNICSSIGDKEGLSKFNVLELNLD